MLQFLSPDHHASLNLPRIPRGPLIAEQDTGSLAYVTINNTIQWDGNVIEVAPDTVVGIAFERYNSLFVLLSNGQQL
jgi:hypothetical protein